MRAQTVVADVGIEPNKSMSVRSTRNTAICRRAAFHAPRLLRRRDMTAHAQAGDGPMHGCFYKFGILLVGVLTIRVLLFGVSTKSRDF